MNEVLVNASKKHNTTIFVKSKTETLSETEC